METNDKITPHIEVKGIGVNSNGEIIIVDEVLKKDEYLLQFGAAIDFSVLFEKIHTHLGIDARPGFGISFARPLIKRNNNGSFEIIIDSNDLSWSFNACSKLIRYAKIYTDASSLHIREADEGTPEECMVSIDLFVKCEPFSGSTIHYALCRCWYTLSHGWEVSFVSDTI